MSERVLTVDDVWQLPDDPTHLDEAAALLRARAAELEAAGDLVRRGQHALGQLLDWIEVPMTWHPGRLTFFPRDGHDLAAITAAHEAAEEIRAAVHHAVRAAAGSCRIDLPLGARTGRGG